MALRIDDVRRQVDVIWLVVIIAIVALAGIGVFGNLALYCNRRGGSYSGGLSWSTNGWKAREYRMRFSCTR